MALYDTPNNPTEHEQLFRQMQLERMARYGGGAPASHYIGADGMPAYLGAAPLFGNLFGGGVVPHPQTGHPTVFLPHPLTGAPVPHTLSPSGAPLMPPGMGPGMAIPPGGAVPMAPMGGMPMQGPSLASYVQNQPIALKGGALAPVAALAGAERERDLGFDTGAVAILAGATTTTQAQPDGFAFQGTRLTMADNIADGFIINSFTIGGANQLVGGSSISCSQFKAVNTNRRDYSVCPPGSLIILNITNVSAGPLRFTATFNGKHVRAD